MVRSKLLKALLIIIVVAGGIILLLLSGTVSDGNVDWAFIVGFLAVGAYGAAHYFFSMKFRKQFKSRIIGNIISFLSDDLNYRPEDKIPRHHYDRSKIFKKRVDRYRGEDYIAGRLGETEISFSELHSEYKTESTSNGSKKTSWHTIFKGVFFIADFNKHFKTAVFLFPDTWEKTFGKFGQRFQTMKKSHGDLIKLEDPDFEREFAVYGYDQIEARYILSTSLMQRMLEFKRKTRSKVHVSFVESNVNIAISLKKNLFEPRIFKPITDFKFIKSNFDYLLLFTGIVEDLNLNHRIWTKR